MATTAAPPNLANPNQTPPETTTESPPTSSGYELNNAAPARNTSGGVDDVSSVNSIQKKMKRAERFGVPVQLSEEEKRNSRAERFGTASGSEASKSSEELKKKARAERFGIPQAASRSTNEESKKKARLERFGVVAKTTDSSEEEKKKARAIRFSESQSNSKAQRSGRGPIESKTMGEAGVV